MSLFELPPEILTNIYCNLSHTHEAIYLAQTCTTANELLRRPLSCQHILQSIISMNDSASQHKIKLAVLNKLYSWLLENSLPVDTSTPVSLPEFLAQFDGIMSNSLIDTVIIKSARYQSNLMEEVNSTTIGRQTIIARSLHCYVIVSKIAHALSRKEEEEEEGLEQYCSELLEHTTLNPMHDVKGISCLFEAIFEDLEVMVRRGTPKDWPIILTILCIFSWMSPEFAREEHGNLQNIHSELEDPLSDLTDPLNTLSKMFYIQMRGKHPFRNSWNHDAYSTLVQGDILATAQFGMFNKTWHIATCVESCDSELDLDGNGYQRVDASDSFEHELQEGMDGWMERVDCFCYGPSYVFESYPPFCSSLQLWELAPLDTSCLA